VSENTGRRSCARPNLNTPGVSKYLFHDGFEDQESRYVRNGADADCAAEVQALTCMRVVSRPFIDTGCVRLPVFANWAH
jgi:hypothetical protein